MALIGQAVPEKKMFEIVDDGWMLDHGYTIYLRDSRQGFAKSGLVLSLYFMLWFY